MKVLTAIRCLVVGIFPIPLCVGTLIASNTFTYPANGPVGQGTWQASATCFTTFSVTYTANNAWMVARFGVPITNYQDYLGGAVEQHDPDGKWVISRIGYGGSGTLSYTLSFRYNTWLAAVGPSGDCHQYTDLNEAIAFASASGSALEDTPASTFVSKTDLTIFASSGGLNYGQCIFSFPGVKFGSQEAVVLVKFKVPVEFKSDNFGNSLLQVASDHTWFITSCHYALEGTAVYNPNLSYASPEEDPDGAYCSLFVSLDDAAAAADAGPSSPVTQTSGPTGTPTPVQTSPDVATTVIPGATAMTQVPVTVTLGSIKRSGHIGRPSDMQGKIVSQNNLWERKALNELCCARRCLRDDACHSVFFDPTAQTCTGHASVYTAGGQDVGGASYYVLEYHNVARNE